MKQFPFISLLCLSVYISCKGVVQAGENKQRFIPGTYVKEVRNEYAIANDTLIIQWIEGNNYLIVDRIAYQPIRNHKLLPLRYKEENWKAMYDETSQNLYEQKLGKTFSFDPANDRLFEGASPYNKINP